MDARRVVLPGWTMFLRTGRRFPSSRVRPRHSCEKLQTTDSNALIIAVTKRYRSILRHSAPLPYASRLNAHQHTLEHPHSHAPADTLTPPLLCAYPHSYSLPITHSRCLNTLVRTSPSPLEVIVPTLRIGIYDIGIIN